MNEREKLAAGLRSMVAVYRLRTLTHALDHYLRKLGPPRPQTLAVGRATVAAIEAVERAERMARSAIPFDPTGL